MARTIQVILTDDLDGSADAQQVTFGLQGAEYSIDLSPENLAKLNDALAPYIAKAERTSRRRKAKSATAKGSKVDTTAVRVWARENGHKISDRGRVPADIVAAYEAANKS